jgi:hypothetical protein
VASRLYDDLSLIPYIYIYIYIYSPSKKEMEMFKQFLKSFHEDNIDTKEDGEENPGASSSPTVDSLFGHDLLCAQDSISGIDDIPELNY